MSDNDLKDKHGTTGHSWDGIEELNTPLPRWWLYTFYACIVWGIGYAVLFPSIPLLRGATPGMLGFSTRGQLEEKLTAVETANAGINQQLVSVPLEEIAGDGALNQYATSAGGAVFKTWCAQCHGSGAAGAKGYPNLLDDDWLWGGSIDAIHTTITHGIRNETDPDARYSQMPAFGADDILENDDIDAVVNFVMSLSGTPQDAGVVPRGAEVFAENCVSCHGEAATGDRDQGAPNLRDAIWLYGGDYASIHETVQNARFGVMPSWGDRLSEAQIRAVASYVHQLGGGE
ncbi:cytochrome-c oxidase, cbb3-type subunit III [Pseudooceanicola sediminis]|uniref:Cbb3-type cytochrome c oxidase subunit n=1 Tax=Pseudooceanicola sediminis TaxID=2211117 RepID=A0A399IZ08_9RHOB|nr:cytochrome-c oxidase, cbb3-type subunit III [Pseudooceanicola sediminis]KAA2312913.1 cytochrome-c oxidase, cbb3-type subunit III [Puniceibacterium sp. HSS470]RII37687.1 cytochrome-c oxidase, cbb3-type subunit III [Pseudooceanicola sediminis]|tara:strand:+ start:36003 stop:36866 length:864 start_codon:yes stop_codon:yes gene_type:complete